MTVKTEKPPVVAMLTSGGDAPGMNAAIRALVRTALVNNMQPLGVINGFGGLVKGEFRSLGARDVGGILQRGGTILLTSRCDDFLQESGQREAVRNINEAGIDAVVVIGGDGSMRGAHALAEEGIKVIGIPASIDNDVWGTDICVGTDTAMNTIMDAVDKLRDTAASHQRAFLIETMGRSSGYLAVMAGIVCGAEMTLIPEVSVTIDEVAQAVEDAYRRGKTHAIIVNAEGSNVSTTDLAAGIDARDVGFKTRYTILGHIQRGGSPTAYDRLLSSRMAVRAVEALAKGTHGVMTGLRGPGVELIPLAEVAARKREINMEYYHMARVLAH